MRRRVIVIVAVTVNLLTLANCGETGGRPRSVVTTDVVETTTIDVSHRVTPLASRRVMPLVVPETPSLQTTMATEGWSGDVESAPRLTGIAVELVAENLGQPVQLTNAGDGSGRLFIVGRQGNIQIVQNDSNLPKTYLDIGDLVSTRGSEQGLLAVAFHPVYQANGRFFVNYTDREGDSVIAEYRVSSHDPNRADADAVRILLTYDQPFRNHNGGMLAFGPDGYLYIGTGDGGSGGDPHDNAQNLSVLLGKMLRIDVDGDAPYEIPPDNPFLGVADVRAEIWAYGLRNPWRYSFDRNTGDLYIADVGQNRTEEVNFQLAGTSGGQNYGWNVKEGASCFVINVGCEQSGLVNPIVEYSHDKGCSISGGYVYRGMAQIGLWGHYIFGDYCSGRIWTSIRSVTGDWNTIERLHTGFNISSFGEDEDGELYVLDFRRGVVYRILGISD